MQCGRVGNQGYDEILVCTYTGRIFGLTCEPIDKKAGGDSKTGPNYVFANDATGKIAKLKYYIKRPEPTGFFYCINYVFFCQERSGRNEDESDERT